MTIDFTPRFAFVFLAAIVLGLQCSADELAEIQGTWEMKKVVNGVERRIVKTVETSKETFEAYEGEKLIQKHIAEIEVESQGPVKVFRWKLGRIIAGQGLAKTCRMAVACTRWRTELGLWFMECWKVTALGFWWRDLNG